MNIQCAVKLGCLSRVSPVEFFSDRIKLEASMLYSELLFTYYQQSRQLVVLSHSATDRCVVNAVNETSYGVPCPSQSRRLHQRC